MEVDEGRNCGANGNASVKAIRALSFGARDGRDGDALFELMTR